MDENGWMDVFFFLLIHVDVKVETDCLCIFYTFYTIFL